MLAHLAGGEWGNVLEQLKLSKAVCLTPKGHCPGGRAVKGDTDFLLNCPVYFDRWKLVLACRQGCRQRQSKSFPMIFWLLLLLEWHPLRVRLCKQMWLVVISVLIVWLSSDYGCHSILYLHSLHSLTLCSTPVLSLAILICFCVTDFPIRPRGTSSHWLYSLGV